MAYFKQKSPPRWRTFNLEKYYFLFLAALRFFGAAFLLATFLFFGAALFLATLRFLAGISVTPFQIHSRVRNELEIFSTRDRENKIFMKNIFLHTSIDVKKFYRPIDIIIHL